MIRFAINVTAALILFCATSAATTFRFDTDPFAGTTAPGTPGRQIVGNEQFISFDVATDVFSFDPAVFGVAAPLSFLSDFGANIPATGANVIVLQDTPAPFAAGTAANLIANQVTVSAPGFFIYFNSGLDLPRLVFSADLNDNTADLKVLARLTNLTGQLGRNALPTFSESNFDYSSVPEPGSFIPTAAGLTAACAFAIRRRLR